MLEDPLKPALRGEEVAGAQFHRVDRAIRALPAPDAEGAVGAERHGDDRLGLPWGPKESLVVSVPPQDGIAARAVGQVPGFRTVVRGNLHSGRIWSTASRAHGSMGEAFKEIPP